MKKTQCKFQVNSIIVDESGEKPAASLAATAVTGGSAENDEFFAATPSGSLNLHTVNPSALEGIEQGDEILITIEKAVKAEATPAENGEPTAGEGA